MHMRFVEYIIFIYTHNLLLPSPRAPSAILRTIRCCLLCSFIKLRVYPTIFVNRRSPSVVFRAHAEHVYQISSISKELWSAHVYITIYITHQFEVSLLIKIEDFCARNWKSTDVRGGGEGGGVIWTDTNGNAMIYLKIFLNINWMTESQKWDEFRPNRSVYHSIAHAPPWNGGVSSYK